MKKKYILIIVVIAVILLYPALRSPSMENISIIDVISSALRVSPKANGYTDLHIIQRKRS